MATILVVDDEAANRHLLRIVLEHDGHEVVDAHDGAAALELAAEHRPQLMIVDLYMPGMTGTEFIKRVRTQDDEIGETRIALYTGSETSDAMRDFMEMMRIDTIIPKPAEPEAIIEAVRTALA